jgi:ABC-type polysaccharide/polyol phosphate export permease
MNAQDTGDMENIIVALYTQGNYRFNSSFREELRRNLGLLRALLVRDLKAKYRRSQLGFLWNFFQPFLQMVVYIILRMIVSLPTDGNPIILFILSGIIPWTYFVQVSSGSPSQIMANVGIFRKVNVPRELFLINGALVNMVEALIGFLVLAILMIVYRVPVNLNILWLIVLGFLLVTLALGLGLLLTAIGIYRADILVMINPIFQAWFFATPIFYPLSSVPEKYLALYSLNPMVGIITGFRNVIKSGQAPDLGVLGISLVGLILIWVVAWPLFRRVSPYFADVL